MNNVVECVATKEDLVLGAELGICRVHLEGDSKIITNRIMRGKLAAWHLDKHLKQIRCLLQEFEDFKVSHIYKKANKVAEKLANMGANVALGTRNEIYKDLRSINLE